MLPNPHQAPPPEIGEATMEKPQSLDIGETGEPVAPTASMYQRSLERKARNKSHIPTTHLYLSCWLSLISASTWDSACAIGEKQERKTAVRSIETGCFRASSQAANTTLTEHVCASTLRLLIGTWHAAKKCENGQQRRSSTPAPGSQWRA